MNLQELKERMYMENAEMVRDCFMEYDDYDTSYVITNEENEDDFIVVNGKRLLELIHNDFKIEYVGDEFCLGVLNNKGMRVEYL